jgi:hypothetical protein
VYQLWQGVVPHIPKIHRYTFGGKIDTLFLDTLEFLFRAQYAKPEQKIQYLVAVIGKTDSLKFFLQIGWENKLINQKQYVSLSQELQEIGRMLGGWKKGLESKLPPKRQEKS